MVVGGVEEMEGVVVVEQGEGKGDWGEVVEVRPLMCCCVVQLTGQGVCTLPQEEAGVAGGSSCNLSA